MADSRFSPEYKSIQEKFHVERPDYGMSGRLYADHVESLSKKLQTKDILDYGCGKCTLQKSLPFPIQNYDPFIREHSKRPNPAAIVVCTDVLEHIEPNCLTAVLQDLYDLTISTVFLQVATGAASKFLPDGRNAHLIQEPINWWLTELLPFFQVAVVQDIGTGFIFVGTKC